MSDVDMVAEIARLKAELAQAKAASSKNITFKVSDKGGISVYGLGQRFPVTLYVNGWEAILNKADELKSFIETNRSRLSTR